MPPIEWGTSRKTGSAVPHGGIMEMARLDEAGRGGSEDIRAANVDGV